MKLKLFSKITALLFVCSLTNCKQFFHPSDLSGNMSFQDVKYVDEFSRTYTLKNKKKTNIDLIGMKNFAIHDSLLIISTSNADGLWSFICLKTGKYLGSFLTRGQGPFQFIESPSVSNKVIFTNENDSTVSYIYDFQRGELLRLNIARSLELNKLNINVVNDSLPPFLFNFIMIDSTTFFCKETSPHLTQQIRYIKKLNSKIEPTFLTPLNRAQIRDGEDINILSTIAKRNDKINRIVEMPIGLRHINIYSLDGTFSRTINIGEQSDKLSDIQDKFRWNRIYTFADLRVFDNFFGVVYINEDEKTYQTGRKRIPTILLFDWDGNPLAELKLSHHITSFDIDFNQGELYTFDVHADELYKYDIKHILDEIQ
ncbi:TolB-like 6-bladed beta-propeller domain-containing protein [Parapedobacter koreensis]|uniref:TolB-like 6-blade propeller-like n=1 Tax=Parapedobacter koreensis TaxID=332977 RepID=A0A1H7F189_9SPHI|nr:hypothetical protein [Parapedobacter koreensis]SEK19861.1 hypothetical protein SAMN05421740_101178 [Parapedobacter koreensis]